MAHSFVQSQEMLGIKVEPQQVGVGETVSIGIDFKPYGNNTICGIEVNFGDGTAEYLRIEENKLPIRLGHTYARAGTVVVQAEGKTKYQGLSTSFSCLGGKKTAAVVIRPDDFAIKEAEARAAKKAALERLDADRRAAEAIATQAAQNRAVTQRTAQNVRDDKAAADKIAAAQRAAAQRAAAAARPAATQPPVVPAPQVPAAPTAAAPAVAPAQAPKLKSALDL